MLYVEGSVASKLGLTARSEACTIKMNAKVIEVTPANATKSHDATPWPLWFYNTPDPVRPPCCACNSTTQISECAGVGAGAGAVLSFCACTTYIMGIVPNALPS